MSFQLPERVSIFEVAPRDGLQNEASVLPTDQKVQFINRLTDAGLRDIEVGSFVNPKRVPQVADTEEVLSRINRPEGARFWTLVPNLRGYERAVAANVSEIAVFMSTSESHNKSNVNRSIAESMEELRQIVPDAVSRGISVRGYVSTVFGCPYEGEVDVHRVGEVCEALVEAGVFQLALGDTIGVANPLQVQEVVNFLSKTIPLDKMALHFHDTRGLGVANSLAGLQAGITTFDASLGGIGGCPFAPGATGNMATEDLLNMLAEMKIKTGMKLDDVCEVGVFLRELLGRDLPSRYHRVYLGLRNKKVTPKLSHAS